MEQIEFIDARAQSVQMISENPECRAKGAGFHSCPSASAQLRRTEARICHQGQRSSRIQCQRWGQHPSGPTGTQRAVRGVLIRQQPAALTHAKPASVSARVSVPRLPGPPSSSPFHDDLCRAHTISRWAGASRSGRTRALS